MDGVGGVCVSGGMYVVVGRWCYLSYMRVSLSGGVHWARGVGKVVVGYRCSRGYGFQALHCRRLVV